MSRWIIIDYHERLSTCMADLALLSDPHQEFAREVGFDPRKTSRQCYGIPVDSGGYSSYEPTGNGRFNKNPLLVQRPKIRKPKQVGASSHAVSHAHLQVHGRTRA